EPLVEELGHVGVIEGLSFHDVAPVAGAIADRQEDELAFLLRPRERLGPPRVPVHGVVGVLPEGRALFLCQPVRGPCLGVLGRLLVPTERLPRAEGRQNADRQESLGSPAHDMLLGGLRIRPAPSSRPGLRRSYPTESTVARAWEWVTKRTGVCRKVQRRRVSHLAGWRRFFHPPQGPGGAIMESLRLASEPTNGDVGCCRCESDGGRWDRIAGKAYCPDCQESLILGLARPLMERTQKNCCAACGKVGTVCYTSF